MSYCEQADIVGLGEEFTIPAAWVSGDITSLIAEVDGLIDELTHDQFSSVAETYYFDGTGHHVLYLTTQTKKKLISVTTIHYRQNYNDTDDFSSNGEQVDADTFVPYDHRIERIFSVERVPYTVPFYYQVRTLGVEEYIWRKGQKNYRVIGQFGWATVPAVIKRAAVLLCRERIEPGYARNLDITSERWPDYGYTRNINVFHKSAPAPLTGIAVVDHLLSIARNRIAMPKVV